MPNPIDNYGREILSEPIATGGVRYFAPDRSVCVGLKPASPAEALRIFNATPPARFQQPESQDAESDELIDRIAKLNASQRRRLKTVLLNLQKEPD